MRSVDGRESVLRYGILVMAATHIFIHVFDRIYPALFPVFRDEFGLTLPQLGLLASIPSLFRAVISLPSGYISDRFGSKSVITLGFLVSISSALAVALSRDPFMLTLSISGVAIASTLYHPASLSYTSKIASKGNRAKAIGMQSAGGPLGMALGPISLSLLISYLGYGWRFTYLFWIPFIALILIAVWRLKPVEEAAGGFGDVVLEEEAGRPDEGGFRSLISMGLVIFLIYSTVRNFGGRIMGVFLPTYLHDIRELSVAMTSLIYGSVSIMGVLAAPLGGFFADRFGNKCWLLLVLSSSTLCLALALLSPSTALFVLFYFCYSFLSSSGMAANSSIIAGLTPSHRRGMGYALFFLPGSLVGAVAPTIGGFLAESMGLTFLFPLGIVIIVASLLLLNFGVKV